SYLRAGRSRNWDDRGSGEEGGATTAATLPGNSAGRDWPHRGHSERGRGGIALFMVCPPNLSSSLPPARWRLAAPGAGCGKVSLSPFERFAVVSLRGAVACPIVWKRTTLARAGW